MSIFDSISDKKRQEFNKKDWRIDGLPDIILPVRIINATGLGLGPSLFTSTCLFLIERLLIQPALKRSLNQMQYAEESGKIPTILCNGQARHEMKERLRNYKSDLENCTSLTCVGKIMNYLAAVKCLRTHQGLLALGEEAHEEKVVTPVFIASLPRTGSTILHRLMAIDDKRWRTFDFCDQMLPLSPLPISRQDKSARRKLAGLAANLIKGMEFMYPGWNACLASVHSIEVDQANEDHVWYNSALGHPYVGTLMLLHQNERAKADKNNGISPLNSKECAKYRYAWVDMILRIYQHIEKKNDDECNSPDPSSKPYIPWLMKDPRHATFLPELLAQFPDAKLIFTHRPPSGLFPSVVKLLICNTCTFNIPGEAGTTSKEWGEEVLKRTKDLCNSLVEFTKEHEGTDLGCCRYTRDHYKSEMNGNDNISKSEKRIDISFNDFVADIPAAIVSIYEQLFPQQPRPTPEIIEKFNLYIQNNRSKSTQRYKLEDFLVTQEDVSFPEYVKMFC